MKNQVKSAVFDGDILKWVLDVKKRDRHRTFTATLMAILRSAMKGEKA